MPSSVSIYNYLYINYLYNIIRKWIPIFFNCSTVQLFGCPTELSSVIYCPLSSFLYPATECHEDLVVHAEAITVDAEVPVNLQGLEVQSEVAVVLKGRGDELAVEHLRVAFHAPGQRLREGEVRIAAEEVVDDGVRVAAQNALIALACLHLAVAAQLCLQIHAQMRVVVPNFFYNLLIHIIISVRENPRSHTRAPPHNAGSETGLRSNA